MSEEYFFLSILVILCQCVAFNYGDLDSTVFYKSNAQIEKKRAALLNISYEYFLNGKKKKRSLSGPDNNPKSLTEKSYKESSYFHIIENGLNPDLTINVEILEVANVSQSLAMLSGLSLGILPSWGESEVYLKTTYFDNTGKKLGEVKASGSSFMVIQLFMLIPMPFFYAFTQYDNLFVEINNRSINEAIRQGILK